MDDYKELIERLRSFEIDHEPDGWPGVRMRQISAMCDAIESLLAENERLKHNLATTEQTMREYQELAAKRLEEIDRLKTLEESALKVCAELDSIVMVMPYDYLDPPDGGNVPMSEQISRMWSEVKELRAELAKYRDAPVVAWVEVVDSYEGPYHFNGEKLLNVGKHKLIVKPGEEK